MRSEISFTVSADDRQRLRAIVADPKSPRKHVWRARIVLLSDEGVGTSAIMAETGKSKTCVWRWQERFMHEGVDGLLRDRSRPPGKAPVPADPLMLWPALLRPAATWHAVAGSKCSRHTPA